jgi:hypothetical protein
MNTPRVAAVGLLSFLSACAMDDAEIDAIEGRFPEVEAQPYLPPKAPPAPPPANDCSDHDVEIPELWRWVVCIDDEGPHYADNGAIFDTVSFDRQYGVKIRDNTGAISESLEDNHGIWGPVHLITFDVDVEVTLENLFVQPTQMPTEEWFGFTIYPQLPGFMAWMKNTPEAYGTDHYYPTTVVDLADQALVLLLERTCLLSDAELDAYNAQLFEAHGLTGYPNVEGGLYDLLETLDPNSSSYDMVNGMIHSILETIGSAGCPLP